MINKYLKVIAKNAKKFVANINSFAKNHPRLYWLSLIILLGLVYYPYILTGSKIAFVNGDFDYFLQNYEAIRKTILEYHQFPWWNPWSGGGVATICQPSNRCILRTYGNGVDIWNGFWIEINCLGIHECGTVRDL